MEPILRSFLSRLRSSISSLNLNLQIVLLVIGVLLVILGLVIKNSQNKSSSSIEVLDTSLPETSQENGIKNKITIDVEGAVKKPGVYELEAGSRVDDAIQIAEGFSSDVDKTWIEKNLNRATKLTDGQKLYIPSIQQSNVLGANNLDINMNVAQSNNGSNSSLININTSSLDEIESLPGIGQVYGQKIIDNRPYSEISELLSKGVLKESLYEKLKDKISVY